ncbi:MAG: prepilin-type N-terminal cleavage/methylation domain-containing protein [Verrucomicrobiota bacterium]
MEIGNGFSLVEMLVAVALLSFIVLGLVAMFGQTQRAFRMSMTAVDVLETGSAMTEMQARELAEIRPAYVSNAVNFFVETPQVGEAIYAEPLRQALPPFLATGTPQMRTNYLQPFFFLSHPNQMWPDAAWVATGYYVVPDNPGVGVGTLYRYSATNYSAPSPKVFVLPPALLYNDFIAALSTVRTNLNVTRVAEGIVELRVRPFATNGFPIVNDGTSYGYTVYCTNALYANNLSFYRSIIRAASHRNLNCPERYDRCQFWSNAVPAYVELELGILEAQAYQRFKAISSANVRAQLAFLSNHVAQVHLFRQRIPMHNVDPSAY